jgi:nitrogen-specific signal transduction histidine kinase
MGAFLFYEGFWGERSGGLPLVKDVVHQHGGVLRLRISTTLGHSGSVFTIFLPGAFFTSPTRTLDKAMSEPSSMS